MAKRLTEDCYPLAMSQLTRAGLFQHRAILLQYTRGDKAIFDMSVTANVGAVGQRFIELSYTTCAGEPTLQRASLETTRPHYGGSRLWFSCPDCERRASRLYLPRMEARFACRRCHGLAYRCQRESDFDRTLRRARKVRARLGGSRDLLVPFPHKPKWMRWAIYDGLLRSERLRLHPVMLLHLDGLKPPPCDTSAYR
jgi:hypothetical protein